MTGMFTLTDLRVLVDMPYGLQRLTECIFYKRIFMPNATKQCRPITGYPVCCNVVLSLHNLVTDIEVSCPEFLSSVSSTTFSA